MTAPSVAALGWVEFGQLGFHRGHQVGRAAFQGAGDLEDQRKRGYVLTPLDLAHVRPLDPGQVGQRFLCDPLVRSFLPHHCPKRDRWFRFVCSCPGWSAALNRSLLHCQKRRSAPRYKPR